jgi:hypothetical protein
VTELAPQASALVPGASKFEAAVSAIEHFYPLFAKRRRPYNELLQVQVDIYIEL